MRNATKPKLRHLPRTGDRHSPGYMADYMRRWRAARKPR